MGKKASEKADDNLREFEVGDRIRQRSTKKRAYEVSAFRSSNGIAPAIPAQL